MSLRELNGNTSLLRIYCGDFDRAEHHPLYQVIVERARKAELAGCTAFSGFWGYGARGFIHTDSALEGAGERPILIEIVDSPERVKAFAREVVPLLSKADGLITEETVLVHHYQHESQAVNISASPNKQEPAMDRELTGENVLLRIFIGESDRFEGKPLFDAVIMRAKGLGIAGCTVIRAVMGFGASSVVHKGHVFRLSQDNPMLIEVVDSADRIHGFLEDIRPMLQGALVTEERVQVHHYASARRA
jgi:PII-like signaling protein